ncbi:MAG: Bug family tripartite tricarboxylate transporter substrate binding protein [Betaproteobacteria bacterium]
MNIRRTAVLAVALLVYGTAAAQDFPSKTVRLIVPFPPGGAVDIIARSMGPPLSRGLGQNIMVENRPGGNTVIGAELVFRAPADGHTVFLMAQSYTVNSIVRTKLPYDTFKDFTGVTRLASNPLVVSVHPSVPTRSLKELVALARARPGELTYATASLLGGQRLAMELFKEAAKIDVIAVAYGGGAPAGMAVIGGHTMILVANIAETAPFATAGKLRALAVTSLERHDLLPKIPSIAESGYPGFEALNWFGAVVRSPTPKSAIQRLNAEIGKALETPEAKGVLTKQGLAPATMSPEAFDAFLKAETERNARVIKALNLKVE